MTATPSAQLYTSLWWHPTVTLRIVLSQQPGALSCCQHHQCQFPPHQDIECHPQVLQCSVVLLRSTGQVSFSESAIVIENLICQRSIEDLESLSHHFSLPRSLPEIWAESKRF